MQTGPRGYRILECKSINSGKMYFARRWGRRYAIKEYSAYRFLAAASRERAVSDGNEAFLAVDKRAQAFLDHLVRVWRVMRKNCRKNGLLNIPQAVFRQGVNIYKVTRLLEPDGLRPAEVSESLSAKQQDILLKTVLSQLVSLEAMHFVHGDLKPENLVLIRNRTGFSAAMIDYEAGFFAGEPKPAHEIAFTPGYTSPEMKAYQLAANDPDTEKDFAEECFRRIGCAADIFSAACIFVLYLTGKSLEEHNGSGMLEPADLLTAELPLHLPVMRPFWRMMIGRMLSIRPEDRPGAGQILEAFAWAEKQGLPDGLSRPFERLQGYQWKTESPLSAGGQEFLPVQKISDGRTCLLWHLEDCFDPPLSEKEKDGQPVLRAQKEKAGRRKAVIRKVLERLAPDSFPSDVCLKGTLVEDGWQCFLEQQAEPWGPWLSEDFRVTAQEADRIMLRLLETMQALHSRNILNCMITREDLVFQEDSSGRIQPFLIRPQRLIPADEIPDPEDLDIPAELLAPEVCLYLGSHEEERRHTLKKMIGPWSDFFSLGLIYHKLLSGVWPEMSSPDFLFPGLAAEADESGNTGLLFQSSVDAGHRDILRRMTAYEPEDRPSGCAEIAAMIRGEIPASETKAKAENMAEEPAKEEKKDRNRWRKVAQDEMEAFIDLSEDGPEAEPQSLDTEEAEPEDDIIILLDEADIPENSPGEPDTGKDDGKYVLSEEEPFPGGPWQSAVRTGEGTKCLVRISRGMEDQDIGLSVIRRLGSETPFLLRIQELTWIHGKRYAVAENLDCYRGSLAVTPVLSQELADKVLRLLFTVLQRLHQNEIRCGVICPGNILMTREDIQLDPYEYGFFMHGTESAELWANRIRGCTEQIRPWASPEVTAYLAGKGSGGISAAADLYSLGLIYAYMLTGSCLPEESRSIYGGLDEKINWGRRWLIHRLLSGAITEVSEAATLLGIIRERDKQNHSVTVKRDEIPIAGQEVVLWAEMEQEAVPVGRAVTNEKGKAVFYGAFPRGKYYVCCGEEYFPCRWRSRDGRWMGV